MEIRLWSKRETGEVPIGNGTKSAVADSGDERRAKSQGTCHSSGKRCYRIANDSALSLAFSKNGRLANTSGLSQRHCEVSRHRQ